MAQRPDDAPDRTVRRLVLVRHAKSERPAGVADRDRPLAARGRRDAEAAGRWLAENRLVPDLVLCSDAARARETWEAVAAGLRDAAGGVDVRFTPDLYDSSVDAVVDLVAGTGEEVRSVLVIGHEPTMSEVAEALSGPASDGALVAQVQAHLPTSGIVVLEQEGRWDDLQEGSAALTGLAAPRG
jgi:phosphohistidine phosphatase